MVYFKFEFSLFYFFMVCQIITSTNLKQTKEKSCFEDFDVGYSYGTIKPAEHRFMISKTFLPSGNNLAPELSLEFCPTLTFVRVSTSLRIIGPKIQRESEQEGGIFLSLV